MLFSRRKGEAEALVDLHPNAGTFSERDRWVFVAGAMMGLGRGHDIGFAEASRPCEIVTDGWCATHSTGAGPVYCEREVATSGRSVVTVYDGNEVERIGA